eukprot:6456770-Amphidinium_carterae.1
MPQPGLEKAYNDGDDDDDDDDDNFVASTSRIVLAKLVSCLCHPQRRRKASCNNKSKDLSQCCLGVTSRVVASCCEEKRPQAICADKGSYVAQRKMHRAFSSTQGPKTPQTYVCRNLTIATGEVSGLHFAVLGPPRSQRQAKL